MTDLDWIAGAAVFDLNGLPREYFTTAQSSDLRWVQMSFQALGLQSLLVASLQLEGFQHVLLHSGSSCAIVVKQKTRFLALLTEQIPLASSSDALITWAQSLEPAQLRAHSHFIRG